MLSATASLSLADLERVLVQTDPAVLVVSRHLLRSVVRRQSGITGFGLHIPHADGYVIGRDVLLASFREDLDLPAGRELPDVVVLLPQPDDDDLAHPTEVLLRTYWRRLFHTRLIRELRRRGTRGPLTDAELRNRIGRLGATPFAEAALVLEQDHRVLPEEDDRAIYEEFIAWFLELRFFAPHLLRHTFPSLPRLTLVERIAADDVTDLPGLVARSRPEGAAAPVLRAAWDEENVDVGESITPVLSAGGSAVVEKLTPLAPLTMLDRQRAEKVAASGNLVRAALLLWRPNAPDEAYAFLDRLLERFTRAIGAPDKANLWREPLRALLRPASTGVWALEGRLLYDLQKVCVDLERPLYAVEIIDWAVTLGRRPIQRLLPFQGEVRRARSLRSALSRLPAARLASPERLSLWTLLHEAIHHAEEELRRYFRPRITDALVRAGLCPVSYAERVACDMVIDELLDRVVAGGYLTLGDLRDTLARNRLKLPDLAGPREFLSGDPLLRANENLASALDGVYHRGEIYLRGLQRFSSLFFGTRPGRFLFLWFILPILGAFLLLEGFHHIVSPIRHLLSIHHESAIGAPADPGDAADPHQKKSHMPDLWSLSVTAVFLFALLHSPRFRHFCLVAAKWIWRLARSVLWDTPSALIQPLVRTGFFQYIWWLALKPALYAALILLTVYLAAYGSAWLLLFLGVESRDLAGFRWWHIPWDSLRWVAASVFGLFCLLLNTRMGARFEDALIDSLARLGRWLGRDALPALFNLVMDFFKHLLERVDRLIYTVDEKLRFREGQSRWNLVGKALFAVVWGIVTYVVRFALNLLIEPQFNPIKHFPVVTVSHKLIYVLLLHRVAELVAPWFGGDLALALAVTTVVLACIPGIFGFLAWELKENWRLYRANESANLLPRAVGSHGESVLRLLHPGFHSGTLPKLFAALRHAEAAGLRKAIGRQLAQLHHVQEAISHFAERSLLRILAGSRRWQGLALQVGGVRLGVHSIRVTLNCLTLGDSPLVIDFEEEAGYLVAGLAQAGWLDRLSEPQRAALADALAGVYKRAGVDLIREQVRSVLPEGTTWVVTEKGMVVRTGAGPEAIYDLAAEDILQPRTADGRPAATLRALPAGKLRFSRQALPWKDWTSAWEDDQLGKSHGLLLPGVHRL